MKKIFIIVFAIIGLDSFSQSAAHACSSSKVKAYNAMHNNNSRDLNDLHNYDEKFLKLELNVSNTSTFIDGKCTHLVKVVVPSVTQFVFELHENLTVTNAKINNVNATATRFGDELVLEDGLLHSQNELVTIEISYNGTPPTSTAFNGETGVYNAVSPTWGVQATWTLSEPFFAHTWFPAKQILTDKIDSTELSFICNNNLKVGSNGLLVSQDSLPNNKTKFTWKSHYPIAYYLVSFAVAPYQEYSYKILPAGASDSLLIQNFVYNVPNYINTNEADILETGEMIHLLTDLYGPYPFINEKYGHCIAPLSGGMEHQTMTTQGFFANWLTVHELGHQWWGDNVTGATWSDIWINEGFASYSENLYYQNTSQTIADNDMLQRHANIMNMPDGSLYVYDITNSDRIFDSRLTYDKGAAVVHMLRNMINNDSIFFATLKNFQQNFKNSTCTSNQLKNFFSTQTGIDFTDFIQSWVYEEGYPTYSGRFNTLNDTIYINIAQESSTGNIAITYPSFLELKLEFTDGTDSLFRIENSLQSQNYFLLSNKIIDNVIVDPNNWIVNKNDGFMADENLYFQVINNINTIENIDVSFNNPFTNILVLNTKDSKNEEFYITNLNGETIFKSVIRNNTTQIDTKNWDKGIYFINFKSTNQVYSSKILKL